MSEQQSTDTPGTAPPAPERTRLRRLTRRRSDKVLAGVCSGLGAHTGTDPVLWRIGFVVATLITGGMMILAYILAAVIIPAADEDEESSSAPAPTTDAAKWLGIALLILGLVLLGGMFAAAAPFWGMGGGVFWGVLLIGAGVALWNRDTLFGPREHRDGPDPSPTPAPEPPAAGGPPTIPTPPSGPRPPDPPAVPAPPPPRKPRDRSPLGRMTMGAAVLALGAALLLDGMGAISLSAERTVALLLAVIGGGLLVGAWWGRARWLIAPGALLTVILLGMVSLPGHVGGSFAGVPWWRMGDTSWMVHETGSDLQPSYRHGMGRMVLDLSELRFTRDRRVEAAVGAGELRVLVPDDVDLTVIARVGAGQVDLVGQRFEGTAIDRTVRFDAGPSDDRRTPPHLTLELQVGFGQLEVERVRAPERLEERPTPQPTPVPEIQEGAVA